MSELTRLSKMQSTFNEGIKEKPLCLLIEQKHNSKVYGYDEHVKGV